jgi:hypothetical protein
LCSRYSSTRSCSGCTEVPFSVRDKTWEGSRVMYSERVISSVEGES